MPFGVTRENIDMTTWFGVLRIDIHTSTLSWSISNLESTAWAFFCVNTWNHFKFASSTDRLRLFTTSRAAIRIKEQRDPKAFTLLSDDSLSFQLSITTTWTNIPSIEAVNLFNNDCPSFPLWRECRWDIILKTRSKSNLVPFL